MEKIWFSQIGWWLFLKMCSAETRSNPVMQIWKKWVINENTLFVLKLVGMQKQPLITTHILSICLYYLNYDCRFKIRSLDPFLFFYIYKIFQQQFNRKDNFFSQKQVHKDVIYKVFMCCIGSILHKLSIITLPPPL